jgi:DNA-binding IclR family transcriptional regulator
MPSKTAEKKTTAVPLVDAVTKALEILDCFTAHETELSLNQLCDKTGLYKSRVHRLCGTLITAGYLVRTSRTNYRLGPKLMVLGKVYEKTNSLRSIAAPFMRRLTETTGESTALFVIDGMKCICMAREMGSSRLVYSINEGDFMELHPTAAGRVLLAYADEKFTEKVLSNSEMVRFTAATLVDRNQIKKELSEIRERGYAVNIEGREQGIAAIAAPVFDFENKVPAALAIVGPTHRFSDENSIVMLESLLNATREMSRLMGES